MSSRQLAEKQILDLMDNLDPSGNNKLLYEERFKKMNATEFKDFMIKLNNFDEFLRIEYNHSSDNKHIPNLQTIHEIAKKYNVPLTEYIAFPHSNPEDPDNPTISVTKCPRLAISVRKMRQMGDQKNKANSDIDTINTLTGQVTGDSKSTRFTNVQSYSLEFEGMNNVIHELSNSRADNNKEKEKLYREIENNGKVNLKDIKVEKPKGYSHKQSIKTLYHLLLMAGYKTKY